MKNRGSAEDRLDLIFRALGDRTRRAMLSRLGRGPAIVRELAEPHAMSLPAVCKHLRVLERAGLARRSVDGRVHHCALAADPLRTAEEWLASRRQFWVETLDALAQFAENEGKSGAKKSSS